MRSVRVRYGKVTREEKARLKGHTLTAGTQQVTRERTEEERILAKFQQRAREDYGKSKLERSMGLSS